MTKPRKATEQERAEAERLLAETAGVRAAAKVAEGEARREAAPGQDEAPGDADRRQSKPDQSEGEL